MSEKSIIFRPFNSNHEQQEVDFALPLDFEELLENRDVFKFNSKTRAPNRDYEKSNNLDFDNGVYHKFVYKNQPEVKRPKQSNELSENERKKDYIIRQAAIEQMYLKVDWNVVRLMISKYKCWP